MCGRSLRVLEQPAACWRVSEVTSAIEALRARVAERERAHAPVPGFDVSKVGESFEGREIHLIRIGSGSDKILLWSQMHGDEPSATPALFDMLHYLVRARE